MRLSKNFSRWEFECSCCKAKFAVDYELILVLEDIREHFGKPVRVTSGYRCKEHNDSLGSSETSQHRKGKAADIQIDGVNPSSIYEYLTKKYEFKYGIGKYNDFIHVDTRSKMARWNG